VSKIIYLDHNATTPFHPDLQGLVPQWMEVWGNPSSIHWAGREPKAYLREARARLAQMLNVEPLELIFTSGGSEANNLAIKGICTVPVSEQDRNQVVISAVEHPSVLKAARSLSALGYRVDMIKVSRTGELDLRQLQSLLSDKTALVSVMLANNETGDIFPIAEVAKMSHAVGAKMHCDAVQGLGKLNVDLRQLGVDLASFSGHKFYALKGCGLLYSRRGTQLNSLIHGGGQERGRRAGTENLLSIASLGHMAGLAPQITSQSKRVMGLRDRLESHIVSEISHVQRTGGHGPRLPNTSSLIVEDVDGETLLMNLDVRGFAVSTGAACSAGNPEPSPTLLAMGLTREEAQSSLRISLGWATTEVECDSFVEALVQVVERLRGFKPNKMKYGV
jgi:cysteine desulfurase